MASSSTGVILLDSSLNLIASNQDAFRILAYPTSITQISRVEAFLRDKVHASLLLPRKTGSYPAFVSEFRSGERRYSCGAYFLERRAGHRMGWRRHDVRGVGGGGRPAGSTPVRPRAPGGRR